jgi:rhamnogalacturonan acetylesterase
LLRFINALLIGCVLCGYAVAAAGADATTRPTAGPINPDLPTLFIIGDSTVHNTTSGLCGWGDVIGQLFDTSKINIQNRAMGGRSSRTFMAEGRWDRALADMKSGDFVLMQFGHNDGGAINDTSRARGSIRGNGDESQEIDNQLTGKHETVHSYGWYMRKYIADTKAKNATPIVLSLVPRNQWKDGKVIRGTDTYVKWAQEAAQQQGAAFIDLNDIIARHYEQLGPEKTNAFFPGDHTHTSPAGAMLNAQSVVEGIKALGDSKLSGFLKDTSSGANGSAEK